MVSPCDCRVSDEHLVLLALVASNVRRIFYQRCCRTTHFELRRQLTTASSSSDNSCCTHLFVGKVEVDTLKISHSTNHIINLHLSPSKTTVDIAGSEEDTNDRN